jgi:hypothetical protein
MFFHVAATESYPVYNCKRGLNESYPAPWVPEPSESFPDGVSV